MPRRPRIYITGDTHGYNDIDKLTSHRWPEGSKLTKDDVLIIAGDFGLMFSPYKDETERYWLDWLDGRPWTTLFKEDVLVLQSTTIVLRPIVVPLVILHLPDGGGRMT